MANDGGYVVAKGVWVARQGVGASANNPDLSSNVWHRQRRAIRTRLNTGLFHKHRQKNE